MNSIFSSLSPFLFFFFLSLLFYSKTEKKIITTLWGPSFLWGAPWQGKRGQPERRKFELPARFANNIINLYHHIILQTHCRIKAIGFIISAAVSESKNPVLRRYRLLLVPLAVVFASSALAELRIENREEEAVDQCGTSAFKCSA